MQTSDELVRQRRYLAVAEDLLAGIQEGRYTAGERLPAHSEVAVMYNVSRPTAREAFLALELIGAIEVRHGDGTFVSEPAVRVTGSGRSPLDVPPQELIETRFAIEPVSTGLAARRITADRIALLEHYLEEQDRLVGDQSAVSAFVEWGLRFHGDLAPGCGNSILADVVGQLVNSEKHPLWALVNQRGLPDVPSRRRQVDEHRAILDAVRSGNSTDAANAMRKHLGDLSTSMFGEEH